MPGKQAKILHDQQINDLLVFASTTRNPLRNKLIVLLSVKAGLRAGEIAGLTWDMVLDPSPAALARSRRRHDCGRYPRAQFSAPDRHSPTVRRWAQLWTSLLPTSRLRRDHRDHCQRDRCHSVRPPFPKHLSAVRAVRDLAVLLPARSRHMQRQSDRRPKTVSK
jgi:integrase